MEKLMWTTLAFMTAFVVMGSLVLTIQTLFLGK